MKRKETDNITGILISAVGEKKVFSHYGKRLRRLRGKGNKGYLAGTLYSGG